MSSIEVQMFGKHGDQDVSFVAPVSCRVNKTWAINHVLCVSVVCLALDVGFQCGKSSPGFGSRDITSSPTASAVQFFPARNFLFRTRGLSLRRLINIASESRTAFTLSSNLQQSA